MELIDVNTQDFQYLTLSQFNGEKKYVRARCQMRKDEPFIQDTSNAFVCVESFRLSCAPNEGGIVYRMLPNTYSIQIEQDESKADDGADNTPLEKTQLGSFSLEKPDAQTMSFLPLKTGENEAAGTRIDSSVNISDIVEGMAHDLNSMAIHKGTVLDVVFDDTDDNPSPKVTVLEDPLPLIRGPGMGALGVLPCYCQFVSNKSFIYGFYPGGNAAQTVQIPPDGPGPESQHTDQYIWAQIRINKADVPGVKINDLATFLSSKVSLYREDIGDAFTGAYFKVFGPMFLETDVNQQTAHSLNAGESHMPFRTPLFQLYCKNTMYKQGTTCFMDATDDNGKPVTTSSKITYMYKWYDDMGDHFLFYLSGLPTQAATTDLSRSADRHPWSNSGIDADGEPDTNLYYIYKTEHRDTTDLFDCLSANVSIQTNNTTDQMDEKSEATFKSESKSRYITTRRPTLGDPIPVFTPLDMFERFNTGWKDSAPIQMMTDPNGGFRITILEDGIDALRVSVAMLYDMGLNTFITQEGIVSRTAPTYEYKCVALEVHSVPGAVHATPDYKWCSDYSNPQPIQSHLHIGNLEEYTVIDPATQNETFPLRDNTQLPCYVVDSAGKFFKILNITYSKIENTEISNQYYEGRNFTAPDGLEYIEWRNPVKGAYIGNDNQVSVGSFSIYENIRLVATGFGFQPFIVADADQPVLCELRLPYSNAFYMASGAGANQLTITNTTVDVFGDIIYEAPASGHQYLRLNSQQPIYDMTIEPRLIPRDPSLPQERVMLGFSDVFQVKLRFVLRN